MSNKKLLTIYETHNKKYALEFRKSDYNVGYTLYFYKEELLLSQINLDKKDIEKMLEFIEDFEFNNK